MTEIEILTAVKNNGGSIPFTQLLNNPPRGNKFNPADDSDRLQNLLSCNLLSGSANAYGTIALTPAGLKHLDDHLQKVADRRKQFAHDWRLALFSVIGGALLSDPLWILLRWIFEKLFTP